jgi:parvulin-like peptidyl-prolyl isomerase
MSITNRVFLRRILPATASVILAVASAALPQSGIETAQTGATANPDAIVLKVGDKSFTAAEFERIVSALPPQFRSMMASLGRRGFAEQFANLYGLSVEGEKRQLHQGEEFQRMLEFERLVLLAQVTMNAVATESGVVGPEEVDYYYQTHAADFEQVKATGIYIPFAPPSSGAAAGTVQTASAMPAYTELQAQRKAMELRARIQSGQDMAALAKTESSHPTAANGGDFGYFGRSYPDLPSGLVNSIYTMQPRQVSAPLKHGNGFFLFRLEDKRLQPLDELRQAIQASLSIQKVNRRIESLKESYAIELNSDYFPNEPPPGGTSR